jgi:hypothetical protein
LQNKLQLRIMAKVGDKSKEVGSLELSPCSYIAKRGLNWDLTQILNHATKRLMVRVSRWRVSTPLRQSTTIMTLVLV